MTVKELLKACKEQVAKGNGDKSIVISNDDEGNGYHYLWYAFTYDVNEIKEIHEYTPVCEDDEIEDTIILG